MVSISNKLWRAWGGGMAYEETWRWRLPRHGGSLDSGGL